MELFLVILDKVEYLKKCLYAPYTLYSKPWPSTRECPNFLSIIQEPNIGMEFHKKTHFRPKKTIVDFFD
jgi:hypothetical protein